MKVLLFLLFFIPFCLLFLIVFSHKLLAMWEADKQRAMIQWDRMKRGDRG